MGDFFESGDIVYVRGYEGNRFAKIVDVTISTWGTDYKVRFNDGSEIVANGYLIEKINYLEFIDGKCPGCGESWKETSGFMEIYKDCTGCRLKQEEVRKEWIKKVNQKKKPQQ